MAGAICSLVGHSEKQLAFFSASLQLLIWDTHSPSGHSGHASFHLARQNPICISIHLGGVYYTILHFQMVVVAVVEVVVCVGGRPVNTGCRFASLLLHMDIEERNRSFGFFLNGEVYLCAMVCQMFKETLSLPVAMFLDVKDIINVAKPQ